MPRSNQVQAIIEEVVGDVLENALPGLRAEIIRRAVPELQSLEPAPGNLPTDLLNAAAISIQEATAQAEILRHLLEGVARFCDRSALFVIKGGSMNGWQGTGFENNEAVKGFSLATNSGLAGAAIQGKALAMGRAEEFDAGFAASMGAPHDGNCVVLPLVVKEKVAALVYADAGKLPDSTIDSSAITLLSRFTGLWLELTALRKAGAAVLEEHPHQPTPSASAGESQGNGEAATVVEEDDLHKKARRYARLLVDEIKLYNQSKVAEGRQRKDLYDRLREDIEKSRTAYEKRFGTSPAASANYFTQELIRVLADNDISLMGGSFPH